MLTFLACLCAHRNSMRCAYFMASGARGDVWSSVGSRSVTRGPVPQWAAEPRVWFLCPTLQAMPLRHLFRCAVTGLPQRRESVAASAVVAHRSVVHQGRENDRSDRADNPSFDSVIAVHDGNPGDPITYISISHTDRGGLSAPIVAGAGPRCHRLPRRDHCLVEEWALRPCVDAPPPGAQLDREFP